MYKNLIEANELKTLLNRPNGSSVIVYDCRFHLVQKSLGYESYKQGHIPGAYYLDLEKDLSSPIAPHGGRHPLPNAEQFQKKLQTTGLNPHSSIVVYCDSRFAYASRAWWLFKYFGHNDVKILNGGYSAWLAINGAVDRREPPIKSGGFKAHSNPDSTLAREQLQTHFEFDLIDSREEKRYLGLEEPIDPIAGHIPGAKNYFWQDITDEKGYMKALEWQKEHWLSLNPNQEPVVYCGSGVTACVNILSLDECDIKAKLYAGSWSDWCSYL